MAPTRRNFRATTLRAQGGAVAQLGERLVRNEEVRGSNPLGSTSLRSFGASAGKPRARRLPAEALAKAGFSLNCPRSPSAACALRRLAADPVIDEGREPVARGKIVHRAVGDVLVRAAWRRAIPCGGRRAPASDTSWRGSLPGGTAARSRCRSGRPAPKRHRPRPAIRRPPADRSPRDAIDRRGPAIRRKSCARPSVGRIG